MNGALLDAGLELLIAGMGTVFVFLTLLVFATKGMSALIQRLSPPAAADSAARAGGPTPDEIAAISAAISHHRRRR